MKMSCLKKSSLLIAISVFCFGIEASAQLPHFGAKVGVNLANIYGPDASSNFPDKKMKPGLVVGGYMTYDIIPLLSIQPEVLFSMKGTKATGVSPQPYDYTQSYNYIEVPVLLKLNIPLGPVATFKPSIFAGPDFAFNVASSEKFSGQYVQGGSATVDTKNATKSFDFNVAVGAGAGFDVGPTNLGLELRYTFGTGTLSKQVLIGNFRNGVFAIIASAGI
jgi:Outer membrane protein beta-barrel domain